VLFGALLTFYRKSLLHRDDDKKIFAIASLVDLLALVGDVAQMEIVHILLHVLVMPLQFRCTLFGVLRARFQGGDGECGWRSSISDRVLYLLLDRLTGHIDAVLYANAESGSEETRFRSSDEEEAARGDEEVQLWRCVGVVATPTATEVTFQEDVQGVLELVAAIERYLAFFRQNSSNYDPTSRSSAREEDVAACLDCLVDLVVPAERSGQRSAGGYSHDDVMTHASR
jgi:hypothetical protein